MGKNRVLNLDNFQPFQAINVLSDPGHIGGAQAIPQCMQVRLIWSLDDAKTAYNVLHARYSGLFAGNVAMANALLAGFNGALSSAGLITYFGSATSLRAVDLRDLNSVNNPLIQSSATATFVPTGGNSLPNEVAACLTLRTAKAGQGFRGRVYLPGFSQNSLAVGNVMIPALVTALNSLATAWLGIFTAQSITATLAQPARAAYTGSTGTQHPARTAQTVDITAVSLRDNHWDTQRRRGLK